MPNAETIKAAAKIAAELRLLLATADCGGFGLAAIHIEAAIATLSGLGASAEVRPTRESDGRNGEHCLTRQPACSRSVAIVAVSKQQGDVAMVSD